MENEKQLIMLVDDNPVILQAGKGILQEKYNVATASSAAKMFEFLKTNKPSLILLDIDMPEMTGYQAIKFLKAKDETKDIPVIFLTGKTDVDSKLEGYSLGAVDYLVKPFEKNMLLSRVNLYCKKN